MSKAKLCVLVALGAGVLAAPANAAKIEGAIYTPVIVAGAPPDSPANRVDPNVAASPYSGVVSLNIRYDGLSFICSGTMINRTHVLTAGHCVDTDGNGSVIDISKSFAASGNDVRAVFNAGPGANGIVTAKGVTMHNKYEGFGNCPVGVPSFCVNDDIAIVELSEPAPAAALSYGIHFGDVPEGSIFQMVGYGVSGDGINGYTIGPNFRIKRQGANIYDLTDLDDEQNFAGGDPEVWYADFDGNGEDSFCLLGLACSPALANDVETNLGGGDSGGPSFMMIDGQLKLVANNTFGGTFFEGQVDGAFGTFMGGILLQSYRSWIAFATPEPGMLGLMVTGFAGLALARRRKQVA